MTKGASFGPGSRPADGAAKASPPVGFDPSREDRVSRLIDKMLSEVRTKLERLRAQEAALCELQRRVQ